MPRIEFVLCPSSVVSGQSFTVDVIVRNSNPNDSVSLQLRRFDLDEAPGPWSATAHIGSDGTGTARFHHVALCAVGSASVKCESTSHVVIPAATSVEVRQPTSHAPLHVSNLPALEDAE